MYTRHMSALDGRYARDTSNERGNGVYVVEQNKRSTRKIVIRRTCTFPYSMLQAIERGIGFRSAIISEMGSYTVI